MSEKTKELTDLLNKGIESIQNSDSFKSYLTTMSKFHSYSARNSLLIFQQYPDASLVAGYKSWKKNFNRQVRKGEKGIRIFAPYIYSTTDSDTAESVKKVGYRAISVFDISQTDGDSLPCLLTQNLSGDAAGFDTIMNTLKANSSFTVIEEDLPDSINGKCNYQRKEIHIDSKLSQKHMIKTLLHEIAHSRLHDFNNRTEMSMEEMHAAQNQAVREAEAEGTAFVVSSYLGLDTSEYTFNYIVEWIGDNKLTKGILDRIQKCSESIISCFTGSKETAVNSNLG